MLVVGFGKRVKTSILPALSIINKQYKVLDVYSKSEKQYVVDKKIRQTVTDLDLVNFSEVDVIIVAITTANVPELLANLSKYDTKRILLYLDTPVINLNHFWAIGYFRYFKNVYISEDYVSMVNLSSIRKVIRSGVLGEVKHIYLFHSGYRHHSVAIIKYLTSKRSIISINNKKINKVVFESKARLSNNISATIVGPRDYRVGKILIVCEKGIISDYRVNEKGSVLLNYNYINSKYSGFTIEAKRKILLSHKIEDKKLIQFIKGAKSASLNDILKIESLSVMFGSIFSKEKRYKYSYVDGIYDRLVIRLSERFRWMRDIRIIGTSKSLIYLLIEVTAFILKRIPISLIKKFHSLFY